MNALETRIAEIATWILKINSQFEYNYFRSEQLRPITKIRVERPIDSLRAVTQVATKRRDALEATNLPLLTLEEALSCGKLIYTCPSDSTLDGGAEFYSQGLVDIWEVPAWDTWVTLGAHEFSEFKAYDNCIISWVPESVYNLFYSGKAVGLEDNMGWITQLYNNSALVNGIGMPNQLEFTEIVDKEAIGSRLSRINQQVMVETDATKASQATCAKHTLWARIKKYFL